VNRRSFVTLFGGAAATWPVAARAQQTDRGRRIGILFGGFNENDPELLARVKVFRLELEQLGWMEGRNFRFDLRAGAGDTDRSDRLFLVQLYRWLRPSGRLLGSLHFAGSRRVPLDQFLQIKAGNFAILNDPTSTHHDPVSGMRAAYNERGKRIPSPGKTQLIELEKREIGHLADRNLSDVAPSGASRGALRRPAQCVAVVDPIDPVARTLKEEGGPHLLDKI
jgi:hypothetical protein